MVGMAVAAAIARQLVNVSTNEVQADGHSIQAEISRDGRLVAFDSLAYNPQRRPAALPPDQEVYLRDRRRGTTRLVSRNSRGRVSNAWSWQPSLSPNGRFLAFCSTASNLARPDRLPRVPHTGPGLDPHTDVFIRDLRRGARAATGAAAWPTAAAAGRVSPTPAAASSGSTPARSSQRPTPTGCPTRTCATAAARRRAS